VDGALVVGAQVHGDLSNMSRRNAGAIGAFRPRGATYARRAATGVRSRLGKPKGCAYAPAMKG
jgi:hypothetical protein